MRQLLSAQLFAAALCMALAWPGPAQASPRKKAHATRPALRDGQAEARLIAIYRRIGAGQMREALADAEKLVQEHPNFQLAQLVYGDLLAARSRPVRGPGDVPELAGGAASQLLAELREDNLKLIALLREAKEIVDEAKDNATSGILDEWTDQAEERAWFLFEASRKG